MRATCGAGAILGLACLLLGIHVSDAATIAFRDQSVQAGLAFTPASPVDMSQRAMYHGGSVGDFNRDTWPDLFLLGGGMVADALFINNGDGTFTDEAASWGVDAVHRGRGSTVGDFNADGWPDIYVTSGGDMSDADRFGQHMLYKNNGNGTFTEIGASAGVTTTSANHLAATGAAFGDYDLDGDLDLFVCGWEPAACTLPCEQNRLFRNNGDETFTDVTTAAGILSEFEGFSPSFVDMNGDLYPELLVAADLHTSQYFINNGDGTFTNHSAASGTGLDDAGMGSAVADFNGDGLPDWYVTSIWMDNSQQDGNYLYLNQGNHFFIDQPESAGAKDGGWGWGAEDVDFDHDGVVDIIETNGWPLTEWIGETAYLFHNQGNAIFTEAQDGSGFSHYGQGRSLLKLDYDQDGDMDIVVTGYAEAVRLYRNDLGGADINWIQVVLDTGANPLLAPDGYGAKVTATAGGVSQSAWPDGGASYLGRSEQIVHFGLGSENLVDILVEWADGSTTTMTGLAANQRVTAAPQVGVAPGEASADPAGQLTATYDRMTEEIRVTYTPACDSPNHTIYYGDLANVSTLTYAGAACWLGASGTASFDPDRKDAFFLVVGHNGTIEGSYGRDSADNERPESVGIATCDIPQDLSGTCGVP